MDHCLGGGGDEELKTFEEVGDHLGESPRPPGADGVPGVIDEDEMTIRHQLLVEMAHFRWDYGVEGAEQNEGRRLELRQPSLEIRVAIRPSQPHHQRPRLSLYRRIGRR